MLTGSRAINIRLSEEQMDKLKIDKMILGMCATNCYFIHRESSENKDNKEKKEVVFIDPAEQGDKIYEVLNENGYEVKAIILTHGHFDHIMGVKALKEKSGAKVYAPRDEIELLEDADKNISSKWASAYTMKADEYFKDGDILNLIDGISCKVISTPGHTIGSVSFYFEEDGILFSGDTLFCESVGRTDFPTGSMSQLARSVKDKLFVLPDDVKVYPGHGPQTTIGYEKENNACV